jgi:hypothetical protein
MRNVALFALAFFAPCALAAGDCPSYDVPINQVLS